MLITPTDTGWLARDGDEPAGQARRFRRPDGRCFLLLRGVRPDALEPLVQHALVDVAEALHVDVDDDDVIAAACLERLGFVPERHESRYAIQVAGAVERLAAAEIPPGYELVQADRIREDDLRRLDDRLRQDVPGTDGWRWDAEGFREETYESPAYDPELYLVARHAPSAALVGIARMWNNPAAPRYGLIAVLPEHRRRGLARGMTAAVFRVLHERGRAEVVTEADDTNVASVTLLESLGARRTGGSRELVRRPRH